MADRRPTDPQAAAASGRGEAARRNDARASQNQNAENHGISEREIEEIEDHSRLRTPLIYEIVCREGEEEMGRPFASLWWSGVAAGLSISFSLLAEAVLHTQLPDASWRPLVSSLGYSVGFLIVVLARQQLFTENTVSVVLPVLVGPTIEKILCLGRIWGIVFLANMVGTLVAALFWSKTPVLTPALLAGMTELSRTMMENSWAAMFAKGIAAGFLIAAMVWLIPSADAAQFHVITITTYMIAAGGFTHIVAGSVEAFLLVVTGQLGLWHMLGSFTLPVLLGNVIGGTALFALISYAQVMREI